MKKIKILNLNYLKIFKKYLKFLSKIECLVKNWKFGKKLNICLKLKIWLKLKNLSKIEKLFQNLKIGQKLKF